MTSFAFNLTETQKIELYLKSTLRITSLTLKYCTFSRIENPIPDVLPGVQVCNNLEKLFIYTSHDTDCDQCSWDSVHQFFRENKLPKEFGVICDSFILSRLPIECLCTNTTIKKLVIECYEFCPMLIQVFDETTNCHEDRLICNENDRTQNISHLQNLAKKLAKTIKENKTLTELEVKYRLQPHKKISCPIVKAMCENGSLQKLRIDDYSATGIDEFAAIVKENTTLRELSCVASDRQQLHADTSEDEWIRVFKILTSSLAVSQQNFVETAS